MYILYMGRTRDTIIYNKNKRTGVTYVYFGGSEYGPDGKCTTKGLRKCVGKLNVRDEFEPNSYFRTLSPEEQMATGLVESPYYQKVDVTRVEEAISDLKQYGYPACIEAVAKSIGLYDSLRKVFPNDYLSMMSMVEALMCYPERPLYSPERFHRTCWHTAMDMPTEGKMTKALQAAAADQDRERFFYEMKKRRAANGGDLVVALDTTSISTYSTMLSLAKYGYNKEGDNLPQINLLMVCDSGNGVPVYYRMLDGNTSDSKTVAETVLDLAAQGVEKGAVVSADRGFCTMENLELLAKYGYKPLMLVPENGPFRNEAIDHALPTIDNAGSYIESIKRACVTMEAKVRCVRRGPGENAVPVTVFVFKDLPAAAEESEKLNMKFQKALAELNRDQTLIKRPWYGKHFTLEKEGTRRKPPVFAHNLEAQAADKARAGIYVMVGPHKWDPEKVDTLYSRRDAVEKGFENWKDKMRRPRHSKDEHLEGKVFIVYLVNMVEAAMREIMSRYALDRQFTLQEVADRVFSCKWKKPEGKSFNEGHWMDLTKEEIKLLHTFGVEGMDKLMENVANEVEKDRLHRLGLKAKRGPKKKKEEEEDAS